MPILFSCIHLHNRSKVLLHIYAGHIFKAPGTTSIQLLTLDQKEMPKMENTQLLHWRYDGKGETFVTLVRVVSDPRVIKPRQEQQRPQDREEHP